MFGAGVQVGGEVETSLSLGRAMVQRFGRDSARHREKTLDRFIGRNSQRMRDEVRPSPLDAAREAFEAGESRMKVERRSAVSVRVALGKPTGNGLSVPVGNLSRDGDAAGKCRQGEKLNGLLD